MKRTVSLFSLCGLVLLAGCSKDSIKSLGDDISPMSNVGVTVSSTSTNISGVSNISGSVTGLDDGVSIYTGTATITNDNFKNILTNFPGTEVDGNTVTIEGLEFKQTTEGIASINGLAEGIIVKYDAEVGDTYKTEDGERTVVSRSSEDDYYYGFYMIKVIQVEETPEKFGVKKITYWANHRFGLVGIEFTFDDGSTAKFPVYTSTENS
ncbi:MAG: hypothetical protein R2751_05590 [Bacteroidales bacterium]